MKDTYNSLSYPECAFEVYEKTNGRALDNTIDNKAYHK